MTMTRHSMELAVAAAIAAFGGAIIAGSLQLSIGWDSTGPQSGYFPFRLGVLLCLVSGLLFFQTALGREKNDRHKTVFATGEQLKRSLSIFTPTLLLVLSMPWAGCYLTSGIYLMCMARVYGKVSWKRAGLLGIVLIAALYSLFDYWFMVPLAKGPVENWLGIY